jgi:excisionase family DNA binding protein
VFLKKRLIAEMNTIQIQNLTVEDLEKIIRSSISEALVILAKEESQKRDKIYGTRKELAKYLRISLPTLHNLTKSGILTSYHVGSRVLYKWDEIEMAVTELDSIKYQRAQ